jgi:hypothetical protein
MNKSVDIYILLGYYVFNNSEEKSSLLKLLREFLVGGKETRKVDEDGLGVSLVNDELMAGVPVIELEYDGTQ